MRRMLVAACSESSDLLEPRALESIVRCTAVFETSARLHSPSRGIELPVNHLSTDTYTDLFDVGCHWDG